MDEGAASARRIRANDFSSQLDARQLLSPRVRFAFSVFNSISWPMVQARNFVCGEPSFPSETNSQRHGIRAVPRGDDARDGEIHLASACASGVRHPGIQVPQRPGTKRLKIQQDQQRYKHRLLTEGAWNVRRGLSITEPSKKKPNNTRRRIQEYLATVILMEPRSKNKNEAEAVACGYPCSTRSLSCEMRKIVRTKNHQDGNSCGCLFVVSTY